MKKIKQTIEPILEPQEQERRRAMLLVLVNEASYVPMKLKELAMLLDVPRELRGDLKAAVDSLVEEGKLAISAKGKIGKPEYFALTGIFSGHPKGFGFVAAEGREEDIFIPEEKVRGALDGDRVQVVVEEEASARRAQGRIVRILKHANETVVGVYQKSPRFGFVIPDNPKISTDIFIPQGCDAGAVTGHKVTVRIRGFADEPRKKPEGVVTGILGHMDDPGVDILSLIRAYGLPEEFPGAVEEETEDIPSDVQEEEIKGRLDLRGLLTVTIDGEEAKDLDDAITLEQTAGGWRLGVHIADVTHYVKENSPLDEEALRRGTSIYLTDRVIPMLPHRLSNGICSLNQGEDRLALSCLLDLDGKGAVMGHEIAETVIRVDRRMTYTAVEAIVTEHDPKLCGEYAECISLFEHMKDDPALREIEINGSTAHPPLPEKRRHLLHMLKQRNTFRIFQIGRAHV